MTRTKPYARSTSGRRESRESGGAPRDTESAWKHDLHDARPALLQRLGSSSGSASPASGSLAARLAGGSPASAAGRELLPASGRVRGLKSDSISNAGKELLPASGGAPRTARAGRGSRPRGSGEGAAFAANALGTLRRERPERTERSERERRDKPVSINGAARSWVRVEHLAPGTTGADVKSAFSSSPILRAEVTSHPGERDVVVELEVPDRAAAEDLVRQYDGVSADGQKLRVSVVARTPPPASKDLSQRLGAGAKSDESSGKMYSDQIQMLRPQAAQPQKNSLAARIMSSEDVDEDGKTGATGREQP